ncbi:MAG TPA: hypothetical protein VK249_25055 [Anaerolineales bacterium]|nr:hypothetical protein [Anaerolineales bacterium]
MLAYRKFAAAILLLMLPACSAQQPGPVQATEPPTSVPAAENVSPAQETYQDPFAYCAAIGTIDAPDTRYTGPKISDEIINGYKAAAGLEASSEPMEMFKKTTIWRCMDHRVYACNFGANLPCSSKANTDQTPSPGMAEYCKANPDSDFIPMSVTGHDTIYSWHCVKGAAQVLDQISEVDAAGYLANIWYPITAGTSISSDLTATPNSSNEAEQILFTSDRGGSYDDLYLLDTTSLQVTRLTQGDSNVFAGPFSPDGKQILFTGFGLTHSYVGVMNADGSDPMDLTNEPNSDEAFPAWSPDGSQIIFTSRRDGNNEIYVMDSNVAQLKRLTDHSSDDFAPAWSPDGSQIAFLSDRENRTGVYSIYLMNPDGSGVKRLTNDKGNDYSPAWSPDGSQIAFRSVQNGQSDIYLVKTDGSGMVDLTNSPAEDWSPAWSPDGSLIAFQSNRDGNWEIYTMKTDGTHPVNLTKDPADDQMPYWRK